MMMEEMANMEEHTVVVQREASSIFKKSNRPVTLKFEDVVYKVIPKKEGVLSSKGEEKVILKGTNGMVKPGEMLAMLGPSGSGKTTLLTALGGRLSGRLSGSITYNGNPFSSTIKRNMGFVTQDDVLYASLTVTETLVFTALLRLPNSVTKQEKIAQAEAVIAQLGLSRCKNSIIGGGFIRGVSGGERKRVSIGQEMLINPSLLLLDEPTSGLDSTTAQRIVSTLWELANAGKTVVMTIHQPSSRVFYMFHKVMLLSEGNMIYFGNGMEAMDYFASVGYAPSVAMNPADFLLDLANGISTDNGQEDQAVVKADLVSAFKAKLAGNLKASLHENSNTSHQIVQEDKRSGQWTTTWWQQFTVLIRRGLKERRHETFAPLRIGQVLVVAILAGLLWWRSTTAHLQDQIGLLFFYTGFWGFYPVFQALFTFPPERKILEKERSSGMYRLSSYFAARTFGDLPMELVLPTAFVTITYFMGGLKLAASSYFKTLFSILLSVLTAQSFGLAIGAVVMDTKSAGTLASVLMLAFQLAGGYMVTNVPAFISWIKYISFTQFTYKLLLASQYKADDTYPCNNNSTCLVGDFPSVKLIGLGQEGISVLALIIMAVAYRLIAYIALMRIGVTKN